MPEHFPTPSALALGALKTPEEYTEDELYQEEEEERNRADEVREYITSFMHCHGYPARITATDF